MMIINKLKKTMMSFTNGVFFRSSPIVYIMTILVSYALEGLHVAYYRRFSSNCDLMAVKVSGSESLISCAGLCVSTSNCTGVAMRHGACRLLAMCPPCCEKSEEPDDGWDVYCTGSYGKIF